MVRAVGSSENDYAAASPLVAAEAPIAAPDDSIVLKNDGFDRIVKKGLVDSHNVGRRVAEADHRAELSKVTTQTLYVDVQDSCVW